MGCGCEGSWVILLSINQAAELGLKELQGHPPVQLRLQPVTAARGADQAVPRLTVRSRQGVMFASLVHPRLLCWKRGVLGSSGTFRKWSLVGDS